MLPQNWYFPIFLYFFFVLQLSIYLHTYLSISVIYLSITISICQSTNWYCLPADPGSGLAWVYKWNWTVYIPGRSGFSNFNLMVESKRSSCSRFKCRIKVDVVPIGLFNTWKNRSIVVLWQSTTAHKRSFYNLPVLSVQSLQLTTNKRTTRKAIVDWKVHFSDRHRPRLPELFWISTSVKVQIITVFNIKDSGRV